MAGAEPACLRGGVREPVEGPDCHDTGRKAFKEEEEAPVGDGEGVAEADDEVGETACETCSERCCGDEDAGSEGQFFASEEEG